MSAGLPAWVPLSDVGTAEIELWVPVADVDGKLTVVAMDTTGLKRSLEGFKPGYEAVVRDVLPRHSTGRGTSAHSAVEVRRATVHFVRHGQGVHNLDCEHEETLYESPKYFDAELTETGVGQAARVGELLRRHGRVLQVALVSPLTRTLQTATAAMAPLGVPLRSLWNLREGQTYGVHPCNFGRSLAELAPRWPAVEFVDIDGKEYPEAETEEALAARVRAVLQYIMDQRELSELAVVSHCVWLHALLAECSVQTNHMLPWFEQGECRTITVCFGKPA